LQTKIAEDGPVPLARFDDRAMRLTENVVAIAKRFLKRAGLRECSRIGGDTNDGRKRER
jgi:hypothetical protein